jgi:hypothetical protein
MKRSWLAFAYVLAFSAFAGSAFAQDLPNSCSLLTGAEVSQALGVTVMPGHYMGSRLNNVCIFAPTAKFGPRERQIAVTVTSPVLFDASRQSRGPSAVTTATVPGAEAYFQTFGKVTSIHVRKSGKAFEVRMNPGRDGHETQPQIEAIETSLAAKAAARV